jgi:hypothetical protein
MPEPCAARSPLSYGGAAQRHFAFAFEALAGVDVAEPVEPDSPPLADFDSLFDSAFDSLFDSLLVSLPAFFSAVADSVPELLPSEEPPFAA